MMTREDAKQVAKILFMQAKNGHLEKIDIEEIEQATFRWCRDTNQSLRTRDMAANLDLVTRCVVEMVG